MITHKQNTLEQQEQINMHGYLIIQVSVQHMDVMWLRLIMVIIVTMDTGQILHIPAILATLGS